MSHDGHAVDRQTDSDVNKKNRILVGGAVSPFSARLTSLRIDSNLFRPIFSAQQNSQWRCACSFLLSDKPLWSEVFCCCCSCETDASFAIYGQIAPPKLEISSVCVAVSLQRDQLAHIYIIIAINIIALLVATADATFRQPLLLLRQTGKLPGEFRYFGR
jgi:hypothetical protein